MTPRFLHRAIADRERLLLLLEACEAAGLVPIPLHQFHALLYLSDILGPVWSQDTYDGKVLKRLGGPFYPDLQRELDHLVGLGLVNVHDIQHKTEQRKVHIIGSISLNYKTALRGLDDLLAYKSSSDTLTYLKRLIIAIARVEVPIDQLVGIDVTWSDDRTSKGDVIDFAEWKKANYSAYAAELFAKYVPEGLTASPGEKLQLYMRLLERRAQ